MRKIKTYKYKSALHTNKNRLKLWSTLPIGEALVPGVDGERPLPLVERVSLPEQEELDTHELLEEVRRVHIEFGPTVNHVNTRCLFVITTCGVSTISNPLHFLWAL